MRKDDIKKLFFETLTSAGVASKDSLDSVKLNFAEIDGLSGLTPGERKQLFAEYQTFAAKREREELRLAKQSAREDFRSLLAHWGENGELDPDITFRQIAGVCNMMPFWVSLDVEELEDIFQEFISSYESSQRHVIKERHFERKRELFRLLEERWGSSRLPPTWGDAVTLISQHPSTFAGLDNLDKFEVFEDFIMEKLEKEKEERRKLERREGRKKRDTFLNLLESYRNRIIMDNDEAMRWDDFQSLIRDQPAYIDLIGTRNSSQPYDLFTPPPPPPMAPVPQWVPPPPPVSNHDPLESVSEWYIDIPAASRTVVAEKTREADKRFGTFTSIIAGANGQSYWTRLRVHGKPLGIHYLIAEIAKISPVVEVGYTADHPFPIDTGASVAQAIQPMPVYHAAWTEYTLSRSKA